VQEYQQIAALLVNSKRKGLTARLAQLQANRARLTTRMREIDDYMNWFEATQSKTKSGAFADYLKAVQGQNDARPRRRDALSVYLDAMEEQFQN
jgi:septal ring factor EnvC (AmiA/AmiB activator)